MKPNQDQPDSDEEMQAIDQVKKIRRLDEDSNDVHFNRISNDSNMSGSEDKTPIKS